jgi:hypothetical protein
MYSLDGAILEEEEEEIIYSRRHYRVILTLRF